jgi:uncharacterized protein YqhQ
MKTLCGHCRYKKLHKKCLNIFLYLKIFFSIFIFNFARGKKCVLLSVTHFLLNIFKDFKDINLVYAKLSKRLEKFKFNKL